VALNTNLNVVSAAKFVVLTENFEAIQVLSISISEDVHAVAGDIWNMIIPNNMDNA
jgi:hypothetical protein